MSFGPLEFAAYLRRKDARARESAAVRAARAAAAAEPLSGENVLSVISGPSGLLRADVSLQEARVFEAVAIPPADAGAASAIRVRVKAGTRPLVLVLSSHHAVHWHIDLDPGAVLEAVLLAGAGDSKVGGAGNAPVASIGGFYAFRPGSLEFRHLEDEVARCTRRGIASFQSQAAGTRFEVEAN